ncbi:MAG TPA: ABC transporter permease subunit [Opitutales bacterium]|nr:ABC transporter permease subunit [Opitutales bacterium]
MKQSLGHIVQIARLTFLEAVRQRFFNFVLLLMLALIGSASFFRRFDFGNQELHFIANFGMGGLEFFGALLAVVASAQLFFGEMENRTALTLLAKPVRRWAFIAGKLLGVMALLLVFVTLLTAALAAYLKWRQGELMEIWHQALLAKEVDTEMPEAFRVQFGGLALDALLQWLKFDVLAAITLLVASYSNTNMFTVISSFFIYLICQLEYIAREQLDDLKVEALKRLVLLVSWIFPNFQLYSIGDLLVFPARVPIPDHAIWAAIEYSVIYLVVFWALASLSFRRREI